MPTHRSYVNPVYAGPFPDPFVRRADDRYVAYASDLDPEPGHAVEALESDDLVTWRPLGRVLTRLGEPWAHEYWAPEVAPRDGGFYMYFSTGVEDKHHQLRVAVADAPQGPFIDAGRVLTGDDPFTIDAHPFRDDDGSWYLYYARDFLDGERAGTAIVVDRLLDASTLAGERRTVLRATADWQVFRRKRPMYGGIYDWHTLEGPSVVKRDGRYWLFYSGGAWREASYGVSFAVADSPLGPFAEPPQARDGPALLRSVPGHVIGPGHNSVVIGPDGNHWVVYHAWDVEQTARRMCIDRLEWTADGPRTNGPTWTAQPAPVRETQ
ncbi:MAG: glycoside hydrolase family 43 protein [Candidatus Limnocylindria bacterium]